MNDQCRLILNEEMKKLEHGSMVERCNE